MRLFSSTIGKCDFAFEIWYEYDACYSFRMNASFQNMDQSHTTQQYITIGICAGMGMMNLIFSLIVLTCTKYRTVVKVREEVDDGAQIRVVDDRQVQGQQGHGQGAEEGHGQDAEDNSQENQVEPARHRDIWPSFFRI